MFYFSTDFTKICFPEDNFLKSQYLFTCLWESIHNGYSRPEGVSDVKFP